MEMLVKPREDDVDTDISEKDEGQHLADISEESVDIVKCIAGPAIVAIVAVREILVAARKSLCGAYSLLCQNQ